MTTTASAVRRSIPYLSRKDIWGSTWQAFMGMQTDEGGVTPIEDAPGSWTRAMTAESYVYRCVEVRGRAISQVPLRAWQTQPNGMRVQVEHDALDILKNANPAQFNYIRGTALWRYTLGSLDLHGHSAWNLAFSKKGLPSEIYWQIPTMYTPVPDPDRFFGGIRINTQSGVKTIPPEKVCYFKTDSFDMPLLGTSKIKVLRNAINLRMYSARSNLDFFRNSNRPDWVLTGKWKNTEENIETIKRGLRRHFSGESNRQPLVVGDDAEAKLLTTSNKDAEWLAQQRLSQEEISAAFGVPLIYINNYDRSTYDNIKTAKLILWHDTIIPETTVLAEWLNEQFLWRFWPETQKAKIELGFNYAEVDGLGEDVAMVWERFNSYMQRIDEQVQHRVLTPDQARLALEQFANNLGIIVDPWAGKHPKELRGDTHFLQFGDLPVDQLSVQTLINIEAARSSNPAAPALLEDVPGAPRASENAAESLRIQEEANRAQAAQRSNNSAGKSARKVRRKAGPSPVSIRSARLQPIQGRLVQRLKKHFQDLKNETTRNMRGVSILSAESAAPLTTKAPLDPHLSWWDEVDAKERLTALLRVGIAESVRVAYTSSAEDYQLAVKFNDDHAWLDKYMGARLKYIKGIDDTVRDRLRDSLLEGSRAGETVPELTDRVRVVFQSAIDSGSERIARTETLSAYGAASLQSYREAGLGEAQMYDGSGDPECAAVDGMIVSLSEAEQLMADEHPNGTRGCAPVVDLGYDDDDEPIAASAPKPFSKEIVPGITLVA